MSYLVLARKWRPQTFKDLVGQEHVSRTLKNAIDSGRVAHAFIFTGARGVGKTTSARLLAKALNCQTGPTPEPCNACTACLEITAGNSVDVFEIDGASNTSVDDIRELRENVRYLPSNSRFKIFIIDEVHMLSTSAFNALLKTLEEPPPHVKFIFATTEPHKVPITILSRCQRFDFRRIPLGIIVARLRFIVDSEHVSISDTALAMLARKGDGSMRDSLSLLDQVLAFCGEQASDTDVAAILGLADRQLLLRVISDIMKRDCGGLLHAVKDADDVGLSIKQFLNELIDLFRALLILRTVTDVTGILDLSDGEQAELSALARDAEPVDIQRWVSMLLKAERELVGSSYPRLLMESTLIRMATLPAAVPVDELLSGIKQMARDEAVGVVAAPRPGWHTSVQPQPKEKPAGRPTARAAAAQQSVEPQPVSAPAVSAPSPEGGWPGLVEFIRKQKPMLAVSLELVHPLSVTPGRVEVGVKRGSFEATTLGQPEMKASLEQYASQYYSCPTTLVVSMLADTAAVPQTLEAAKNSLREERSRQIELEAREHPAVVAALEIFSASIDKIRDVGPDGE